MDSEASKSMKVPTFSGQAKDYEAWWMRFTAYAALVGFSGALTATRMANLPNTEEEDAGDTEAQKKARVMHNKARYFLVLAMLKQSLLYLMPNTATDEWPGGLVHEFLKKLQKKFKPQDTVSVIELKTSLAKLKLKAGEDPAKLFEDIAAIQTDTTTATTQWMKQI